MTNIIEVKTVEELDLAISANEKVIVDVWASWCAPCKMMLPIVTSIVEDDTSITLVKVNLDESSEVAKKYGIRNIPFFKFYKNGNESTSFVGAVTKADFVMKMENAFA
jgi:thioredoxin 1